MKIRITGTPGECDRLLARLARVVTVREASEFCRNLPPSALCGVYLDVDSTDPVDSTGPLVRVRATRTDTGLGSRPALAGGER